MTSTELQVLRDALRCLQIYRLNWDAADHPFGFHGHTIDAVIANLHRVILKHDPLPPIPKLEPITRAVHKVDKENWK